MKRKPLAAAPVLVLALAFTLMLPTSAFFWNKRQTPPMWQTSPKTA